MSPDDLFRKIRAVFRSHRPPPPYETYTLVRTQNTNYNTPDLGNSYTYHIWVRTLTARRWAGASTCRSIAGRSSFNARRSTKIATPVRRPPTCSSRRRNIRTT